MPLITIRNNKKYFPKHYTIWQFMIPSYHKKKLITCNKILFETR